VSKYTKLRVLYLFSFFLLLIIHLCTVGDAVFVGWCVTVTTLRLFIPSRG